MAFPRRIALLLGLLAVPLVTAALAMPSAAPSAVAHTGRPGVAATPTARPSPMPLPIVERTTEPVIWPKH